MSPRLAVAGQPPRDEDYDPDGPTPEHGTIAHGDKPPVAREVVGTAVGLTVGLSDNRQMTLQSGYADDEPDHVINARLDRAMAFADRQRAKYEIVTLREEIETHQTARGRLAENLNVIDADTAKGLAQLADVQIEEVQRLKAEEEKHLYDANVASGRKPGRVPKGNASDQHLSALTRA